MGCEIVQDKALAKSILFNDWVFDRACDDLSPGKEAVYFPEHCKTYVGLVDSEPASLFIEHNSRIHFMALPKFKMQARELAGKSMRVTGLDFMYCQTPRLYQSVINFAKKMGFEETAVSKPRFLKHGILYAVHRLEWHK